MTIGLTVLVASLFLSILLVFKPGEILIIVGILLAIILCLVLYIIKEGSFTGPFMIGKLLQLLHMVYPNPAFRIVQVRPEDDDGGIFIGYPPPTPRMSDQSQNRQSGVRAEGCQSEMVLVHQQPLSVSTFVHQQPLSVSTFVHQQPLSVSTLGHTPKTLQATLAPIDVDSMDNMYAHNVNKSTVTRTKGVPKFVYVQEARHQAKK